MILTYKYKLKNRSAHKRLREHAIALNQVWNFCVATQRECESKYHAGARKRWWPTKFDLQKLTTGSSKELNTHAGSIHEICRVFAERRDKLKHAPKFRSSFGPKRSLGWVPFRVSDRQIIGDNSVRFLGKEYRWFGAQRRRLPETVKGGAFVEDASGQWWVCFCVEVAEDLPAGIGTIGIDLGLKTLATLSDGTKIENIASFRTWERKLAVAQRARNKKRVRAIHEKIKNCRRDHHHKATAWIAREYNFIAVGDVNPTRLVKTRMAKSVLDAGWSGFRTMLDYKARRHRADFVVVNERFTTQVCSCCGTIPASSPKGMGALGMREWVCSDCGARHDRDVNSAQNILVLALSAQRPDGGSRLTNRSTG